MIDPTRLKTASVAMHAVKNLVGDTDSLLAKGILAVDDTRKEMTSDLIMAGVGIGLNYGVQFLAENITALPIDGAFDITDVVEAMDYSGDALIIGAGLSVATKLVKNYNALDKVNDMSSEEFDNYLSGLIGDDDKQKKDEEMI